MKRKAADLTLRETLRWEPDGGFQRLEQHLRRLLRSADALGLRAPDDAKAQLDRAVGGTAPLAVQVVMNYRGQLDIAVEPYVALAPDRVFRVRIAEKTRLDSSDTFYRHKSSRREPYEAARAEFSLKDADEVLLLNERGEVCEGAGTSIFAGRSACRPDQSPQGARPDAQSRGFDDAASVHRQFAPRPRAGRSGLIRAIPCSDNAPTRRP